MISLEGAGSGIAVIRWSSDSAPVVNAAWVAAFTDVVEQALEDTAVSGVVIAAQDRDFSRGTDLAEWLEVRSPADAMARVRSLHALTRRIETGGKPFVAALNGAALGGGMEIALACHRRIAAVTPRARFGFPDIRFGMMPAFGGAQRLARMIGARNAVPMLLEGRTLNAQDARDAGLIDEITDPDQTLDRACAWAAANPEPQQPWDVRGFAVPGGGPWSRATGAALIAGNALSHARSRGNYPAVQAILSSVYEGIQVGIDTGLKAEARWFVHTLTAGPVARNMIRSLFVHVPAAERLATRPRAVPKAEFTRVGVLGAGMMGAGIAGAAAAAGLETVLLDRTRALAEQGKARIDTALSRRAGRRGQGKQDNTAILSRITPADDYAHLAGCDLVIEAVFEQRAIKAEVTAKAEAVLPDNAVFASNTSTLPISGLAEASARPANFIGLHFFSPVERMPLVEIIRGRLTSDATLACAMDFVRRIRKTPITVNDSRGFYTSRVFSTYVREGFAMLAEGVTPALIENAGKLAGMPVGPLAVADEVSLGLMRQVAVQTRADLGDGYRTPPGEQVLERMVSELGRAGRKAGKGFYNYPEGSSKRLWPGLSEAFPRAADQPSAAALRERLLYVQALEAARCLEEDVLTSAADGDIGSLLGWGFPAWTGGALSLIDTVGADTFVAACDRLAQELGVRFAPPQLLRGMAAQGTCFHDL